MPIEKKEVADKRREALINNITLIFSFFAPIFVGLKLPFGFFLDHNNEYVDFYNVVTLCIIWFIAIIILRKKSLELDTLRQDVRELVQYKGGEILLRSLISYPRTPRSIRRQAITVCIDLYLSNYASLFTKLFGHSGIRASLFLLDGNDQSQILRLFISEYEPLDRESPAFSLLPNAPSGFCGQCWISQVVKYGSYYNKFPYISRSKKPGSIFPFRFERKNPEFVKKRSLSKRRSIMCLPITKLAGNPSRGNTIAVLCLDSLTKNDFNTTEEIATEIDEITEPLKARLRDLIDILNFP